MWANFRALIGIFSQTVGPSLAIWVNPVQFSFSDAQRLTTRFPAQVVLAVKGAMDGSANLAMASAGLAVCGACILGIVQIVFLIMVRRAAHQNGIPDVL